MNDILSNLSVILDEDFGQLFKTFISTHKNFNVFNYNEILKNVNKAFELRNIFVHEYAFKFSIKIKEIKEILDYTSIFIFFVDIMIIQKLKT